MPRVLQHDSIRPYHITKITPQERRFFNSLSLATRRLEEIGSVNHGGRQKANTNSSVTMIPHSISHSCDFIRPFIDMQNVVHLLICTFVARGVQNPAGRIVWINFESISPIVDEVVTDPPTLLERTSCFGGSLHRKVTNEGTLKMTFLSLWVFDKMMASLRRIRWFYSCCYWGILTLGRTE